MSGKEIYYCYRMYVVMHEGRSVEQLKKEIGRVMKPHNYSFEVTRPSFYNDKYERFYFSVISGVYVIGSLILLAAIIKTRIKEDVRRNILIKLESEGILPSPPWRPS